MINIDIKLSNKNIIKSYDASGHALHKRSGSDIICSAVTCLLRTSANLLFRDKEIKINGNADEPGIMKMNIISYPENKKEWIRGISDFLIKGLLDLKNEYPENLKVNISEID